MRQFAMLAAFGSALLLTACGQTQPGRATGGAAGGVTGAATKPRDLNLGEPVWQGGSG